MIEYEQIPVICSFLESVLDIKYSIYEQTSPVGATLVQPTGQALAFYKTGKVYVLKSSDEATLKMIESLLDHFEENENSSE